MQSLSFTYAVGSPVVCMNYFRAVVMSHPGIGTGEDAAWFVQSIGGVRMLMVREGLMRPMTEADLTDAELRD